MTLNQYLWAVPSAGEVVNLFGADKVQERVKKIPFSRVMFRRSVRLGEVYANGPVRIVPATEEEKIEYSCEMLRKHLPIDPPSDLVGVEESNCYRRYDQRVLNSEIITDLAAERFPYLSGFEFWVNRASTLNEIVVMELGVKTESGVTIYAPIQALLDQDWKPIQDRMHDTWKAVCRGDKEALAKKMEMLERRDVKLLKACVEGFCCPYFAECQKSPIKKCRKSKKTA